MTGSVAEGTSVASRGLQAFSTFLAPPAGKNEAKQGMPLQTVTSQLIKLRKLQSGYLTLEETYRQITHNEAWIRWYLSRFLTDLPT